MKKIITRLFVIFPFEVEFFKKHNLEVEYFGNPLLDEISEFNRTSNKEAFLKENNLVQKPIIALLPGSRTQEIKKMLKLQLTLVDKYPQFEFVVAGMSKKKGLYLSCIEHKNINVKVIYDQTYSVLNSAYAAVVCSGTATLETALFNVPEVVCYRGNPVSFAIGKLLVKLRFISLVNLILDRQAVVELLQKDFNQERLEKEFNRIAFDNNYIAEVKMHYSNLKSILGASGASYKIAQRMIDLLEKK